VDQQSNELSPAFIAAQRKRLEALQRQILGGEESTIAKERQHQEINGAEAQEREDDAQTLEQYVANQALRNVNARRIADIQRALEKIDDGTYGYSDESGDLIPVGRLEAVPEAVYTVDEESRRESGRG
jgi:DnaK suppressor protein